MQWLGHYLGIIHICIPTSLIALIIVSHTVYRERWLKLAILIFIILMFIQHMIIGTCFITVLEKKLSKQEQSPFHSILENFLSLFGVTLEQYYQYCEVVECTIAIFLGLEVLSLYLG